MTPQDVENTPVVPYFRAVALEECRSFSEQFQNSSAPKIQIVQK